MEQLTKKVFKIDDVLNVIKDLSHSQGFYGRLLRVLTDVKDNDPDR